MTTAPKWTWMNPMPNIWERRSTVFRTFAFVMSVLIRVDFANYIHGKKKNSCPLGNKQMFRLPWDLLKHSVWFGQNWRCITECVIALRCFIYRVWMWWGGEDVRNSLHLYHSKDKIYRIYYLVFRAANFNSQFLQQVKIATCLTLLE